MSKKWYPVIDYIECIECGACTDLCKHGVYDLKKSPSPVVVFPEGCVEGCHGCGNLCPVNAITYVGDKVNADDSCGCGCESGCELGCSC
jgi:NAD-dependent dihydropyrimidine dehydrogenase PreA subunit